MCIDPASLNADHVQRKVDRDSGVSADWEGVRNLIAAVPKTVQHFVLVTSIGVTKSNELPWK